MKTRGSRTGSPPSSSGSCRSMTSRRLGTPTWIAARPMPGAAYIVSNMSAISARISSFTSSTGVEICRRRGSGTSRIGKQGHGRRNRTRNQAGRFVQAGPRPPRAQRLGERAFVEIVELAADRQAVGELGEADREALEPLGEIMGGGLALERRVHREHDLVDAAGGDSGDQPVDAEILGPDALQRRKPAAEHVEAAREQPRAVERPEVRDLLDHAEQARVAARVGADAAGIDGVDIAAGRADREVLADLLQRAQQRHQRGLALLHQMQHGAPGRARAEPGEPRQRLGQRLDFGGSHDAHLSLRAKRSNPVACGTNWIASSLAPRNDGSHAHRLHGNAGLRRADARCPDRGGARGRRGLCQPPRPAGRGKAPRPSPVQQRAEAAGIEVRTPVSLQGRGRAGGVRGAGARCRGGRGLRADPARADPRGAAARLPQRPCLAAAALARRGADPARDPRRRRRGPASRIMQMEKGLDTGPMLAVLPRRDRPQDRGRADRRAGRDRRAD